MILSEPRCAAPAADWCGEGPLWCAEERNLYWVDINRCLIHRLDSAGAVRSWQFEEPVTVLALTSRPGTLCVALASRLIYWSPVTGERRDHGFRLPGSPAVRLNDGGADPRGSMWLGSMRNNIAADGTELPAGGTDGAIYRIDSDGAVSEWKLEIGISNTFAWSPDHSRFYTADTLRNTIYAYDYDRSTGAISGERIFFEGFERGMPDGSAIDSEGYLWNCRFGGGCVVRVAPNGAVDRVIDMPARNVTSCTFGGEDLRTLFVTSAALGAPPHRLAGSLFALESSVPGLPEHRFL